MMKMSFILFLVSAGLLSAAEKDVWYNSKGEVFRVTKAVKEKQPFVPEWKKRELAREAARREGRDRSFRSRPHTYYGNYGHGYYGGYYVHPHFIRAGHHHGSYRRSPFRFHGTYRGNGWSIQISR